AAIPPAQGRVLLPALRQAPADPGPKRGAAGRARDRARSDLAKRARRRALDRGARGFDRPRGLESRAGGRRAPPLPLWSRPEPVRLFAGTLTCAALLAFCGTAGAVPGPAGHVDVFAGTRPGSGDFGGGQLFPGATMPFGMVQFSPDTIPHGTPGSYDY